jgi:hypothetical protein
VLTLSRGGIWEKVMGGFSRPGKMPGPAWGIPAKHCKTGSELAKVPGTVCNACYARKGSYSFGNVQAKLEERYKALFDPRWVPAMVAGIRTELEPGERFRLFDSGDFQGENHLRNVLRVVSAVRDVLFWAPTREHGLLRTVKPADLPENLVIRLSGNLIDGKPPRGWPWTSVVVSDYDEATCPTSKEGGSCDDEGCAACWDREVKTVRYLKH